MSRTCLAAQHRDVFSFMMHLVDLQHALSIAMLPSAAESVFRWRFILAMSKVSQCYFLPNRGDLSGGPVIEPRTKLCQPSHIHDAH